MTRNPALFCVTHKGWKMEKGSGKRKKGKGGKMSCDEFCLTLFAILLSPRFLLPFPIEIWS